MKPEQGDSVRISYGDEAIEGILIKDDQEVILKLSSGYNIVLDKRKVSQIELIAKKASREKKQPAPVSQDRKLKKISILHTGGTIASKVDYTTGAVVALFKPEELLDLFPELDKMANISSRLVSNIFSENMRFTHYNIIAKAIAEEVKKGAEGIIITHGTDTLHYTSAALAFICENLSVPVIVVGSQRSSDRGSSDAGMNLCCAISFAAQTGFAGVGICMHENATDENCIILSGVNARKMHSSRRDAFRQINTNPLARVNSKTKKIEYLRNYPAAKPKGEFILRLFDEKLKIGLLKAYPNMFASAFHCFKDFDALVIEGTGLGHVPIIEDEHSPEPKRIAEALKELAKKMPVIMCTQTIYGRVNMNVYSTGRIQQDFGVIGNGLSMTSETAFIKIAWLLSHHDKEEAKELLSQNLRGEIVERTEEEAFEKQGSGR
ncbi:MAG: Glu-tRNA(Gln) amidotransferase subunit GatD [Nanoarchaeota archaeon]